MITELKPEEGIAGKFVKTGQIPTTKSKTQIPKMTKYEIGWNCGAKCSSGMVRNDCISLKIKMVIYLPSISPSTHPMIIRMKLSRKYAEKI